MHIPNCKNDNNEKKEDISIISQTFFGKIEKSYFCLNCKSNYKEYEIFKCISFYLEEILDNINIQKQIDDNNNITIYDCFDITYKNKKNNINYCNKCKVKTNCEYVSHFYNCPNILIIILNREKNNYIFDIELDFNEQLNISKYTLQNYFNNEINYELYGVVTCTYQNDENSHFIASCKNPIDKKWYKFEDTNITSINDFQKEVIEYEIPYILFYKKLN